MVLTPILFIPLGAALLCLLTRSRRIMEWLNVAAFGAAVVLGLSLVTEVLALGDRGVVMEWHGFLSADALSAWMVLLIGVVSLGTSLYAGRYFRREEAGGMLTGGRVKEFYVLTPVFGTGMFLVVLANNLGVMWFALEATALSSVLLVALYNRRTSLEAAWKYVILGSLGLALALFGTVFTYAAAVGQGASRDLPSFNWSELMSMARQLDPRLIKLAFVFVLVGYGTKAGLAPMHTWLPDAHSEAPTPTSAMLSGVSLKIAVYALVRFHILASQCLGPEYSGGLLLCFGLFSMFVAVPFILVQSNLKRLLAYSSLEHVGLICAGIGLNTRLTIFGALLHMGYHALTKPVLFYGAGNIHQAFHTLKLRGIGPGIGSRLPATALLMGLAVLAAMGLPPFGLFYSELTILGGGFAAGQTLSSALALAALVAAFCGLLTQFTRILLGAPRAARAGAVERQEGLGAIVVMVALLLMFSLWLPQPLVVLLRQAAAIIGGNA